jgi:hypothetical protein
VIAVKIASARPGPGSAGGRERASSAAAGPDQD